MPFREHDAATAAAYARGRAEEMKISRCCQDQPERTADRVTVENADTTSAVILRGNDGQPATPPALEMLTRNRPTSTDDLLFPRFILSHSYRARRWTVNRITLAL